MAYSTIGWIVAASIGGVVLIFAFAAAMIAVASRHVAAASRALIAKSYPPEAVVLDDDMANNFGIESLGALQLRGNGGLVLTRDLFHFIPLAGTREVRLPLARITNVEIVRSHLGKAVGRPLVKVHYLENDKHDAVALYVRDANVWKAKLEELRG